jgi:hypothetical protein
MTSTLLIYFVLASVTIASDGARIFHWKFSHIEHINGEGSREYCEQLAGNVAGVYEGQPGNMRLICMDDQRVTT